MGLDGVNGKNTKTVYDYQNLDLSKANEKEVANSIIDLANTAQANFDSMKATVDDYGNEIDSQERMEIAFNWLPIIGNAVRKIPSNLRSACTEAINKLKQVMINIAKDMNAASLEDANTGVKVRIDKDGNGTVTFAEDDKNTAYEPQATDRADSHRSEQRQQTEIVWSSSQKEIAKSYKGYLNLAKSRPRAAASQIGNLIARYSGPACSSDEKLSDLQISQLREIIEQLNKKADQELGQTPSSSGTTSSDKQGNFVERYWAAVKKGKGMGKGPGSRISRDMQVVYPESEYNKE